MNSGKGPPDCLLYARTSLQNSAYGFSVSARWMQDLSCSIRLGDNDIPEKLAQNSSCLKPKVFKTTLNTVRSALAAAEAAPSPQKTPRRVTYQKLVDEQKMGRKALVVEWMQMAERTLMKNPEMRRRFGKAYDAITLAVFCWTFQLMSVRP